MYNGTQAFQKTAATFEKDIKENLEMEATDKFSASKVAAETMNDAEIYEDGDAATEHLKKMLDEIGEKLLALGYKKNEVNRIKNMLEKGIKAKPKAMPQIINNTLSKYNNPPIDDAKAKGELMDSTKKLASYLNRREIYKKVQSAADFNLTADQVLGGAISRMPDSSGYVKIVEEPEPMNATEILTTTEAALNTIEQSNSSEGSENSENEIGDKYNEAKEEMDENFRNNPVTQEQIKEINEVFKKKIEELKREIEKKKEELKNEQNSEIINEIQAKIQELEHEVEQLERENTDIVASAIAADEEKIDSQMKDECKKLLEEQIKEFRDGDKSITNKTDMVQLARMEVTYKRLTGHAVGAVDPTADADNSDPNKK